MNGRKLIGAAVVLAAAAPAFAGEMTQNAELDTFVSEKTRVQVLTEIADAYAQGWRTRSIHGHIGPSRNNVIPKTRAQVREEITEAYAQGWKPGLIHGYTGSTSEASTKILDVAGEAIP